MTTYVLMVSKNFPIYHPKKGEATGFIDKIQFRKKLHTIRGNYDLWAKRIDKIKKGEAILSVRSWSGQPYQSKQIEHFTFGGGSGIGLQKVKLNYTLTHATIDDQYLIDVENNLSKNDGLSSDDFFDWFAKSDTSKDMALIHFTAFRY
jgi:hypothetical protein